MKKFLFTALIGASALAFAAGARAEGEAAIHSETQTNSDAPSSAADNSYAAGDVSINKDNNTATVTSTTGTPEGTASATVDANGNVLDAQAGVKEGDDQATPATNAADAAMVDKDMTSKTGVMKTRAKGAMGMLSPTEIKTVQENLKSAGYTVSTDGVWGPQTKTALKEYQKAKALNVTGKMDADTRSSMSMPQY